MGKTFAIPTADGVLCPHFGHCQKFAIVKTDGQNVLSLDFVTPPGHQPGVYPGFLAQQNVDVVISGGMGVKAQELFAQNNIEVFIGVGSETPEKLVEHYLSDMLKTGQNLCDH